MRLSDRYDVALTAGSLAAPLLLLLVLYRDNFLELETKLQIRWGIILTLGSLFFIFVSLFLLYRYVPFFKVRQDYRLVLHYLLSQNFYETVSKKSGQGNKIKLPPVYVKKQGHATLAVTFEMKGKALHGLKQMSSDLEKVFFADFKEQNDFKEKGFFSKRTYSQLLFSDDNENQRLLLEDVPYDEKQGIRLMADCYWNFVQAPHLLIGGGTGGGKTIFLLSLLKVLQSFALVEICDPKKSDLTVLDNFEAFQGHVHSEVEDIVQALEEAVDFMENRYRQMGRESTDNNNIKIGSNFQSYGLKPKFILIDEWAAFYAALDLRKTSQVDDLMAQLILKGRQAGVFLIVAMQRPDGEFLSTNLRDNMMARLSLGKLSKTGYRMIFGAAYEDKNYLYLKSKVGRGYAALDGGQPSEFYSPLIPYDQGFSFEEVFAQMKPLPKLHDKAPKDEEALNLTAVAEHFHLSVTTISRLIQYMNEAGFEIKQSDKKIKVSDLEIVEAIIQYKKTQKTQWKAATAAVFENLKTEHLEETG